MGKRTRPRSKEAKVIFKNPKCKSTATRERWQAHKYYTIGDKVKRDFSLETDFCALRRYYRNKREKERLRLQSCIVKSKHSNRTDVGQLLNDKKKGRRNTNVSTLMLNNLKHLLNKWAHGHFVVKNKRNKNIFIPDLIRDNVKLCDKYLSSTTYVMTEASHCKKFTNDFSDTTSVQNFQQEVTSKLLCDDSSYGTIPFSYKPVRIISTLSIPRNLNRQHYKYDKVKKSKSWCQIRKYGSNHKKYYLSLKDNGRLLNLSPNINLIAVSTEYLIKRMTCLRTEDTKHKRRSVALVDKEIEKMSVTEDPTKQGDAVFSLQTMLKTLKDKYDIEIALDKRTDEKDTKDATTMTRYGFEIKTKVTETDDLANPISNKSVEANSDEFKTNKEVNKKNENSFRKHESNYKSNSNYTELYKRAYNHLLERHEYLDRMEKMLYNQRLESNHNEGKKNMTLDIHVNVIPKFDSLFYAKEKKSDRSRAHSSKAKDTTSTATLVNGDKKFISLLDCDTSRNKIFKVNSSVGTEKTDLSNYDKVLATNMEISQEVNELKMTIRDLAKATETIMNKCQQNAETKTNRKRVCERSVGVDNAPEKPQRIKKHRQHNSIGVQITTDKNKLMTISKIKAQMDPKKAKDERMENKSFELIASESLIKVTDMLSLTTTVVEQEYYEKALTCSLPKSRSLFELSSTKGKRTRSYSDQHHNSPQDGGNKVKYDNETKCDLGEKDQGNAYMSYPMATNRNYTPRDRGECNVPMQDSCECPPPLAVVRDLASNACNKIHVPRESVGFCLGFFYCSLIWVPIIVIMYFFYKYFDNHYTKHLMTTVAPPDNETTEDTPPSFRVSELGF